MTGLMISSYFVVNKRKINVDDLFVGNKGGIYWYTWGINWRAVVAVSCTSRPICLVSNVALILGTLGMWHRSFNARIRRRCSAKHYRSD
jgi:cytosine/uracil/thiamine/allantoin permease